MVSIGRLVAAALVQSSKAISEMAQATLCPSSTISNNRRLPSHHRSIAIGVAVGSAILIDSLCDKRSSDGSPPQSRLGSCNAASKAICRLRFFQFARIDDKHLDERSGAVG